MPAPLLFVITGNVTTLFQISNDNVINSIAVDILFATGMPKYKNVGYSCAYNYFSRFQSAPAN
tara:strand:- start:2881 stop:3069 length:189 start_codon:yes stop_codon:yes gene_type:complete